MLRCDIITIFPEFFGAVFDVGIIRRAKLAGLVGITVHDLRRWAHDKHRIVDDRPFGGGDGMVLKPEPLFEALEAVTGVTTRQELRPAQRVVMLSPQGRRLTQAFAAELAQAGQLVFICGRYEGVDERVIEAWVTDELSIGDYVLSGGEPAAVVVIDSLVRLLPGALGSDTSAVHDSFSDAGGLLDCPQYTRPAEFRGMSVPEVLLGGHHADIARWRQQKALEKTRRNRPDLLT
jgi:tRNA (guanine37-N1)-methyltransferase